MFKKLKNLFCKKQRIKPAEYEDEKIYKSLNAAILADIINQSNISSNTESNNKYEKIYKSLNGATILVHIMLDPDNANRNFRSLDCYRSKQYSSNTESNNSDKNKGE